MGTKIELLKPICSVTQEDGWEQGQKFNGPFCGRGFEREIGSQQLQWPQRAGPGPGEAAEAPTTGKRWKRERRFRP